MEGHGTDDEAAVYCLFSSSFTHIGKALLQRAQGKLGLPSRITEHLTSILRTGLATARSTRAILLRKCPPATLCVLPVKWGRHDWIKASETIAIRVLRPNSNQGQWKPRRTNKHRRRRLPTSASFSENDIWLFVELSLLLTEISQQAQRNGTCLQLSRLPIWTAQSFKEAYKRKQQWILATHGKAARFQSTQDATEPAAPSTTEAWNSCSAFSTVVSVIQGYVKRSRGFEHVDTLLKRFRMPGRCVRCNRSCSQKVLQQAKHAIRAAAKATAAVRGSSMYTWIMSRAICNWEDPVFRR